MSLLDHLQCSHPPLASRMRTVCAGLWQRLLGMPILGIGLAACAPDTPAGAPFQGVFAAGQCQNPVASRHGVFIGYGFNVVTDDSTDKLTDNEDLTMYQITHARVLYRKLAITSAFLPPANT